MTFQTKSLGNAGEDAAAAYLKAQGFALLERNYQTRQGEIDIIAKEKDFIVFVEVKTRTKKGVGVDPKIQMTQKKRMQVRKMGEVYLMQHPEVRLQPRFDFLGISFEGNKPLIEHLRNAF